jgi:hypothetical protein
LTLPGSRPSNSFVNSCSEFDFLSTMCSQKECRGHWFIDGGEWRCKFHYGPVVHLVNISVVGHAEMSSCNAAWWRIRLASTHTGGLTQ